MYLQIYTKVYKMKKAINLRIDESLLEELDVYAKELDRTRKYLIEKAVSNYFDTLDEMISDKRIDDIKAGKSEMFTLEDVAIQLGLKQMFKVIIPKIVFKELEKIDNTDRQLVFDKLKDLENGHFENDKSLQGKHKGKFRKRAGNYRIIYLKENDILLITLVRIAHRKEVY